MDKLTLTGSYDFGVAAVSLMDVHRSGVDKAWMQKRAAAIGPELENYKAASGRTPIHLIALGTTESYGPNANADGFGRQEQIDRHDTFLKNGHVYKEHVNKDPRKASGAIKIAKFNPDMDRTELVIEVDNDKWSDEIQKLASGKDLFFSMAARVPYDQCNNCGNKARSRSEYCGCMRKHAGKILDNGTRVFVHNPSPTWFDISGVRRPADKIAYVLGSPGFDKCAAEDIISDNRVITGAELFEEFSTNIMYKKASAAEIPSQNYFTKLRVLDKLAAIEKKIELMAPSDDNMGCLASAFKEDIDEDIEPLRAGDLQPEIFNKLSSKRVSLPLKTFLKLINADITDAEVSDVGNFLPGIFSELNEDADDICNCGTYDPGGFNPLPQGILSMLPSIFQDASLASEPVMRRMNITIIRKLPAPKLRQGSEIHTIKSARQAEAKLLAREYASYKLAHLASLDESLRERDAQLAVLQNYVTFQ